MSEGEREVVVTGVGPVTPIGVGAEALWASLAAGRQCVQHRPLAVDLARRETFAVSAMAPAPDVPGLDGHLAFLAQQGCEGYRDLAYTLLALELAAADAGLSYDRDDNRIGAIQVFEAPGSEPIVSRLFGMFEGPPPTDGPPAVYDVLAPCFYHAQPFLYVHMVGKSLGLRGFSTSVHNGCASGAFAIELAAQRIREGLADVMLVAGGEAFDTGVRLEWFRRLGLYAQDERMRPFDAESSGFFVGEGAAAIVLESAEHARRRGATPYASYRGGAFAHQAWKQTVPDVRAGRLQDVIRRSLERANTSAGELDLVAMHGAATALADGYEMSCLGHAICGEADQAVATAFKPYVGHMLAASGVIETICTLLAMRHGQVPATLHSRPDEAKLPIPLATAAVDRPIRTALKLSTGFTGHDAASVFVR